MYTKCAHTVSVWLVV